MLRAFITETTAALIDKAIARRRRARSDIAIEVLKARVVCVPRVARRTTRLSNMRRERILASANGLDGLYGRSAASIVTALMEYAHIGISSARVGGDVSGDVAVAAAPFSSGLRRGATKQIPIFIR